MANAEKPHSPPERDPARWLRFKALCIGRGVTADELAEHFPAVEDREDIAYSADDSLATLAEHMARTILAERPARALFDAWAALKDAPARVQCGTCAHFARHEHRLHDGTCRAGVGRSAVAWDVTWLVCDSHEHDAVAAERPERAA